MDQETLTVTIVQMSSSAEIDENLESVVAEFEKAKLANSELIIFPECALLWAKPDLTKARALSEEAWLAKVANLSRDYGIAAVWGGLALRDGEKVFNSALFIADSGELLSRYDKKHLFQVFAGSITVDETLSYCHGEGALSKVTLKGWTLGLSICYDLRFPELYRQLGDCDAMICTAAFTKKTGRAHWELLLRARAVENQTYLLGAGQCGMNNITKVSAFGHSMVVDPWGKVVDQLDGNLGSFTVDLDKKYLMKCRDFLPALRNKRL